MAFTDPMRILASTNSGSRYSSLLTHTFMFSPPLNTSPSTSNGENTWHSRRRPATFVLSVPK